MFARDSKSRHLSYLNQVLVTILLMMMVFGACKHDQDSNIGMPVLKDSKLFEPVDSQHSGVNFVNRIAPNDQLSISTYPYFYNGGGVAAGDVNNDGLVDLFFVANQAPNRLFLNKGDLRFEDISEAAGISGMSSWTNGVTMVDINGDDLLDIYITSLHGFQGTVGKNELFINQGNNTFKEEAGNYGLDFQGYGTQAAFFDFDHDGDLDCYLLNHAVHDANSQQSFAARTVQNPQGGDRLMRNDRGQFRDVTKSVGILQPVNGFGLGISVADFDNDGWEDIYISNDFHEDDLFYLNQRNGTFKESGRTYFGHTSRYSMGSDAADFNNDGYIDLVTLDMAPPDEEIAKSTVGEDPNLVYHYKNSFGYADQYNRNALQLNRNGMAFSDVGPMAGIIATDWSWSSLFADFDLDGDKDLFITNGIERRPNDLDFLDYMFNTLKERQAQGAGTNSRPDFIDELERMPDGKFHNFYFSNEGTLKLDDRSKHAGFGEADIANGAAYADLDNDGDLDLICNRLNMTAAIYENQTNSISKSNSYLKIKLKGKAPNRQGIGAKVKTIHNGLVQLQQLMSTRGFMSSSDVTLVFGFASQTSLVDSIIVTWTSGKEELLKAVATKQLLEIDENNAMPNVNASRSQPVGLLEETQGSISWRHEEDQFIDFSRDALVPFLTSREGPAVAIGDVNGDGLQDVFLGGGGDQTSSILLQGKNGQFTNSQQPALEKDAPFEDVDVTFIDVDNDRDLDLYVVSGGNEFTFQSDRLYINNGGQGIFIKGKLPPNTGNKSCVSAGDFDSDGDMDLFVGGKNVVGSYGMIPRSYLFVNDGMGQFSDESEQLAPGLLQLGMVTDADWVDTDGDGDKDLVVVGEWMRPTVLENRGGELIVIENGFGPATEGLWQSLAPGDFDQDGDVDFIAGNFGINTNLLKEQGGSIRLYAKDFDDNGKMEQMIAYDRKGAWYPAILKKDELGKVLPSIIQKRFTRHIDFAGKTMDQIFTTEELSNAIILEANELKSCYAENVGSNKFKLHALDEICQISTIHSTLSEDVNRDGNLDVIMGGNYYGVHTFQGKYDAGLGQVLLGRGDGTFQSLGPEEAGFIVNGQIRALNKIEINSVPTFLVGRNDQSLLSFSF